MKEIHSILFPTDFSAVANSVLPLAVRIASDFDATIYALHIASGGDPHVTETSRYEFPKPPEGSPSAKILEEIMPRDGDPAVMIKNAASRKQCDLIVMASHGRSDVAQFFLGRSVAEQVARDSTTPTIIARLFGSRRTKRPIERISNVLFATDLTSQSKAILPVAASIARKAGAKLETLIVFGEGDVHPSRERGKAILHSMFAEAEAEDLLDRVEHARLGVAESVVEFASSNETDLIAITSTLCSGGDSSITDAAEFIIRNAPCPVLNQNSCN